MIRSKKGRAIQMNTGAAAAQGDVLLFLHADTRLPKNANLIILHTEWDEFKSIDFKQVVKKKKFKIIFTFSFEWILESPRSKWIIT